MARLAHHIFMIEFIKGQRREAEMMLVIGATGNIGSEVVNQLSVKGQKVRALSRSPEKVTWPPHVEAVKGDLNDSIRTRNMLSDVHIGQFR